MYLGGAVGTGEIIETATGPYEKIAVAPELIEAVPGPGHAAVSGWTPEQQLAAQNLALEFTASELVDSIVLDGGEAAVDEWWATRALTRQS